MMLQFERVVTTGTAALDSGICDTALKTFNGETYLYSTTGRGGGIVSWHLVDGAAPVLQDEQYFDATIPHQVGDSSVLIHLADSDQLILDVDTATGLVGYNLHSDGSIGDMRETDTLIGGGDIAAAVQMSIGTSDFLTLAHEVSGQIGTYRVNGDGTLSLESNVAAQADSLQHLEAGAFQFVIAANSVNNSVATYQVDQVTGALTEVDAGGGIQTLGINTPTAVETFQAYGKSWVVIAGSESNSLSVFELNSNGQLTPKNHVLDTLHTRFQSVQDISTIEVDGRVFVLAGGGDDGISLFTMTPDGQLIHLDSFADTLDSGLQNIQSVSVAHIGDELQIFAASQQDAGLTLLSAPVTDLGIVAKGFGNVSGTALNDMLSGGILDTTLNGGAGDDILITGTSETTMTGGSGADLFVIRQSSGPTTITDFQAGTDRLDLSNFAFLRTPAQLEVTTTAQGARIAYQDEILELISDTGASLTSAEIFGAGFEGPDHIPVDLGSGPDNNESAGVAGHVALNSNTQNPALRNAEIQFTPDGGAVILAQANEQGEFDLEMPDGSFPGQLDITKSYSTASNEITALDALQVLRMSVGLDPTWGPAVAENYIAADVTRDGTINALDALAILQISVNLPTEHDAEWVFLDANIDLSSISRNNVVYETGADVTVVDNVLAVDMTSILLGNIEAI